MPDFRRGMRDVLPPTAVVIGFLLFDFGSWALFGLLNMLAKPQPGAIGDSVLQAVLDEKATQAVFAAIPCLIAAIFGLWRLCGRHPVTRRGYRPWLFQTPWRWPAPLPLGPVLPRIQDLVALVVLTIPALGLPLLPVFVPGLVAVAVYSLAALLASLVRGPGPDFFIGVWAFAAGLYFRETPWAVGIAAVVLLIAASRATAAVLQDMEECSNRSQGEWAMPPAIEQHGPLGWPYDVLAPHPLREYSTAYLLSIAITVGLFLAAIRPRTDPPEVLVRFFISLLGIAIAVGRALSLTTVAFPRLSRMRSDALAPSSLVIVCAAAALSWLVVQLPMTGMNQIALAVATLLAIALSLPPSRETWRLTAHARLSQQRNRSHRTQRRRAMS